MNAVSNNLDFKEEASDEDEIVEEIEAAPAVETGNEARFDADDAAEECTVTFDGNLGKALYLYNQAAVTVFGEKQPGRSVATSRNRVNDHSAKESLYFGSFTCRNTGFSFDQTNKMY